MLFKQRNPIFLFFHSLFFQKCILIRTEHGRCRSKNYQPIAHPDLSDLSLCGEYLSDLSVFFHADDPLFIRFNAVFRRIAQLLIKLNCGNG